MAFKFVIVLALVASATAFLDYCDDKPIDGGITSLPCIIKGMCAAKNDEAKLKGFYACYDDIPTKQLFFDCMDVAFKGQLNNSNDVTRSCKVWNLGNVAPYGLCLTLKFHIAKKDMNAAVDKINRCQATALGLQAAA